MSSSGERNLVERALRTFECCDLRNNFWDTVAIRLNVLQFDFGHQASSAKAREHGIINFRMVLQFVPISDIIKHVLAKHFDHRRINLWRVHHLGRDHDVNERILVKNSCQNSFTNAERIFDVVKVSSLQSLNVIVMRTMSRA